MIKSPVGQGARPLLEGKSFVEGKMDLGFPGLDTSDRPSSLLSLQNSAAGPSQVIWEMQCWKLYLANMALTTSSGGQEIEHLTIFF